MKKILCLPLLLLPLLTSCNKEKVRLTYGSMIATSIDSLKELDNQELLTKTKDDNEVFLLAVYQGEYSDDCLCWNTFKNVVVNYSNTYNELVYVYNAHNQDSSLSNLGIEKVNNSTPYLYVFNGAKKVARFSYSNSKDKAIFEDTKGEAMRTRLEKVVNHPYMYYVDEQYLDKNLSDIAVLFMRRSCGDCHYVIPNVLIPYINSHTINKKIYVFDMQDLYDLRRDDTATEEEKAHYQEVKDRFGLSVNGNATYGYQNGVVPTLSYFDKNGKVDSSAVYFNDAITKKEDGTFYISESYYSSERLPNLKYLKNYDTSKAVLQGMGVEKGILERSAGNYYWSQEEATKYHQPLFEAFLAYYLA